MAINKKCAIGAAILTPVVICICAALLVPLVWVLDNVPAPPPIIVVTVVSLIIGGCVIIITCSIWQVLYNHCVNLKYKRKINKIKELP